MKARVKATGKIVTVERNIGYPGGYVASNGYVYQDEELVLIVEESIDYWTRLEHQYAGMAMQGYIIAQHIGQFSFCENDMKDCVSMAHALVEKLKQKEEDK